MFAQFCADNDTGDVPALNADQRTILVGSAIRDKLGSVALWLREHGIDIKAIEVEVYREGDATLLQPRLIVPLPVDRFQGVGIGDGGGPRPWINNGRKWHLEERCGPRSSEMLIQLTSLIDETIEDAEGPHWNQKFYVSYGIKNRRWLYINARTSSLVMDFRMGIGTFTQANLAQRLGVAEYSTDATLAEKLRLPSSISIDPQNPWGRLYIKQDYTLDSEVFRDFLKEAHAAFPRRNVASSSN